MYTLCYTVYMEYKSLRTFRADLKTAFDYVEAGAEEGDLTIERDGTVFKLVLESWKAPEESEEITVEYVKEALKPNMARQAAARKALEKARGIKLDTCYNGHIIGRFGKCLEKGCKYA